MREIGYSGNDKGKMGNGKWEMEAAATNPSSIVGLPPDHTTALPVLFWPCVILELILPLNERLTPLA